MIYNAGDFPTSATVIIPINTFDSNDPTASVTVTNLVNTDVHIHKDGGTTQRNSAAGITMTIDFDSITGNHLLIIDTSDNTVGDFYQAGHEYQVRVEGVTVDGATINAWVGTFSIERAGGALALIKNGTYGLSALNALLAHADYGLAKLVRSTTPANTLTVDVNNKVAVPDTQDVNVKTFGGETLTAQIIAAWKKFFNVASPTGNVNSLPDAVPGANGGFPTTNGTKINQTVDLTAGQSIACSDKTGFSLSATGADLILKSSTFVQAIVAAVNEFATYGLTALNTLLVTTGIKAASVPNVTLANGAHGGAAATITLQTPIEANMSQLGGVAQSATDLKDFADTGYDPSSHKVAGVVLADTVTTYTGNTPQTGDSYAIVNGDHGLVSIQDDIDAVYTAVITNAAGTDIAADIIALKAETATILADTAELQTNQGDWLTATEFSTHSASDVAALVLATPANKLATDASGNVEANNMRGTDGAYTGTPPTADAIGTDAAGKILVTPAQKIVTDADGKVTYSNTAPPTAEDIKTAIEADGSKLDHLWEMTEDDGGVRRLTTNALELAPSGSGLDAEGVRTAIGLATANLDTQLAALPTDADVNAACDSAITDAALATAANLATVDTVVDAIKLKTDQINAGGALIWTYTVTDSVSGLPISDVTVRLTSDSAGTITLRTGITNTAGIATFYFNPADSGMTVYVFCTKSGYNFPVDQEVIN